ncbi:MAG: DUF3891 family protein [Acidobacteriaceae bacterium]
MLRSKKDGGWWLVTHPDHAYLAGEFASQWGNEQFASPVPREHVLRGIYSHDDGWKARDADPMITRAGIPAAFSVELVGKYFAFEDIDLQAYLAVRRAAVQRMAAEDPYAAILISMHTHNLLSERADRITIREDELPLLDAFLAEQLSLQRTLTEQLIAANQLQREHLTSAMFHRYFQLLQACDNLSLLSCVDFDGDATLLHPFVMSDGTTTEIKVHRVGDRTFRLTPYPFAHPHLSFTFPARFIAAETFSSAGELRESLQQAAMVDVPVTITA